MTSFHTSNHKNDFDAYTWTIVDMTKSGTLKWRQAVSGRPAGMVADFGEWEIALDTFGRTMQIWRDGTYLNWPPSPIVYVLVDTVKESAFDIEPFLAELRRAASE